MIGRTSPVMRGAVGCFERGKSVWDQASGKARLRPQRANAMADEREGFP
jgi:hypothetical protein